MITRRQFGKLSGLSFAAMLVSSWMSCGKAGDLIKSLRGILVSVEHALNLLGALSGLLPDSVNTAARYLTLVCEYVDKVGRLLEDETQNAADRARQILEWAVPLVLPVIPPPIGPIVGAVAAAVNHFLSYFGTDVDHAAATARSRMTNVPDMNFNQKERDELHAIEQDAVRDKTAVADWQKRAMATPHANSSLTTPSRGKFIRTKNPPMKWDWDTVNVSGDINVVNNEGNVSISKQE